MLRQLLSLFVFVHFAHSLPTSLLSEVESVLTSVSASCYTTLTSSKKKNEDNYRNLAMLPNVQADFNAVIGKKIRLWDYSQTQCPFYIIQVGMDQLNILNNTGFISNMKQNAYYVIVLSNIPESFDLISIEIFRRITNIVIVLELPNKIGFKVMTNYFGAKMTVETIGRWSKGGFVEDKKREFFNQDKMKNLMGRNLIASGVKYSPFFNWTELPNGQIVQNGIETDMVNNLVKAINATVNITDNPEGWGSDKDGDGIYNGLVGALQLRRADLGFSQLFIKYDRIHIMGFTEPYDIDQNCFMVRKPPPLPQVLALVRPFTLDVWIAIGILLAVLTTIVIIYVEVHPNTDFVMGSLVMYMLSVTMMESHVLTQKMRSPAPKIFFAGFMLGTFVLAKGYQGGLVSFLTIPLTRPPINTIKEIALANLPTGSFRGSTYILEFSTDPWVVKYLRPLHISFLSYEHAFANVTENKMAIYNSRQFLQYSIRVAMTDQYGETVAHITRECPQYYLVAIGLVRHSPYKEVFDGLIQRFKESGLVIKWTRDALELAGKASTARATSTETKPLTLHELQGPIIIVFILLVPCCIIFAIELGVFKAKKVIKRRNTSTM